MFLKYFKEYSKKNSFRLKRNTDAIIKRFQAMEKSANKELEHLTLEEWDELWKKAKIVTKK